MTPRAITIVLVSAFIVGVGGGFGIYLKVKPTEEQLLKLRIDRAIKKELCVRIEADIDRFKQSPNAFKRTALHVLLTESRTAAKALLHDVPDGYPIRFSGAPDAVVSECVTKARQWVKITSAFPEYYDDEKLLVGSSGKELDSLALTFPGISIEKGGQERRLALVIGNASYEGSPLRNSINDAKDVARFLRTVGFNVTEILDADTKLMRHAVDTFVADSRNYDIRLIYYAGHGIEFQGRNYLLPINASIQSEEEIPRQGFDANEILDTVGQRRFGTLIVVLDACRNAPVFSKFRSTKAGLNTMNAPRGTVIAFSAGPGQLAADGTGRNSPYTMALLRAAQVPNRKIEDVLKEASKAVTEDSGGRQTPWYNSSLIGDFYFATEVRREKSEKDERTPLRK